MKSQLVFIAGALRSGTTAITRLLMAHEKTILVDAHALKTSRDGAPTYESGIFTRDFSNEEIISRFKKFDELAPVILEKTPAHIMHFDRIKEIFPEAKFIFPYRPARDCLRSWKVARRTFIKNGPNFTKACKIWAASNRRIISVSGQNNVYILEYKNFIANTESSGKNLFGFLNLNSTGIENYIAKMRDNRNVRVPGMIGESITGGKTSLTAGENLRVIWYCARVERAWSCSVPGVNRH